MSTKNLPLYNPYAFRKAPKDIEFHYIINQVKYIEDFISRGELAYDNDEEATISLLARYYRNYKGFEKYICEIIIYNYIEDYYKRLLGVEVIGDAGNLIGRISKACSMRRYRNNHSYKSLRDFDGVYITKNEMETIMKLSGEEQEVLFACLCFTKMYNEHNRRQGRKINNLFYVSDSVLRRVLGWKRGTADKIHYIINNLAEKGYISHVINRDKYEDFRGTLQPMFTPQCLIVDDDSEQLLFIDNFDCLHLTLRFILGDKKVKKCECGRYFEADSNRRVKCHKCSPSRNRPKKRKSKGLRKRKKV